jgi:hypothetical protein
MDGADFRGRRISVDRADQHKPAAEGGRQKGRRNPDYTKYQGSESSKKKKY